jgi:hypothetical protein
MAQRHSRHSIVRVLRCRLLFLRRDWRRLKPGVQRKAFVAKVLADNLRHNADNITAETLYLLLSKR